ncbi:hypothetical protein CSA80_04035 [Candidatus Saccharibacteria bacterium]|nr:MAG: hypothetical protein CR973_00050 [Candidatus Saccharibacteria bacterium]PID98850.1 MAG: hypothetical protein CSA80_04035 [Candidatus Saccharibacteria bacterium]
MVTIQRVNRGAEKGLTLLEMLVSMVVIGVIALGFFSLFTALVNSAVLAKQRSVGGALANNHMEYLRSLPYDRLAVSGGSIIASSYLPAETETVIDNVTYKTKTNIEYIDDAYDGCGPYPTPELKQLYCRNYATPGNSGGNGDNADANPADYKVVHVEVSLASGTRLAVMDSQVAARVAETASTTGALFINVTDPSGNAVQGATVKVVNTTLMPTVSVSDSTDTNGAAIFYGLPPDSEQDYTITVEKSGYSTIESIQSSGALQPTYPSQTILSQQSSYLALVIAPMHQDSLIIEAVDTAGAPLANVSVQVKGGYKKYTATSDTAYYFDSLSPTDLRPVTGADGITTLNDLPPINGYEFCGDAGAGGCSAGGVNYYLASAVPYGGANSLAPVSIPLSSDTSAPSFLYGGTDYAQKVRLILTTNSAFPRVFSMNPSSASLADDLRNVSIVFDGSNLGSASAFLTQGGTTYTSLGCTGSATQLACDYDLSGVTAGDMQVTVQNGSGSLVLPVTPLGGFRVVP